MKSALITLSIFFVLALIAGGMIIFSGAFNVSTGWKDPAILEWILIETRENSIKSRASSIDTSGLRSGDKKQIEDGFRSYREMCATCHSTPGQERHPITAGLNPTPPDLTKKREHMMSDAELFWVIKNGIRMTGMPAWGPTHKDHEIWALVALLKVLPETSASEYDMMDRLLSPGHSDDPGEAATGYSDTKSNNAESQPHTPAKTDSHSGSSVNGH